MHAAQIVDERTERFVLDLAGLTFLDCSGARALAALTNLLPSGCPVIIRSLSPAARRILDLLNLDLRQEVSAGPEHQDPPVRCRITCRAWTWRTRSCGCGCRCT